MNEMKGRTEKGRKRKQGRRKEMEQHKLTARKEGISEGKRQGNKGWRNERRTD